MVLREYRSTPCRATGFTPAELLFGRNIRTPLKVLKEQWITKEIEPNCAQKQLGRYVTDLVEGMEKMRDIVKENEGKYKTKCKDIYDRKAREWKFEIGDLVLVRNPDNKIHGFSQVLSGPYVVTDALPCNTYKIHMPDRTNKCNKLHINLLEKCVTPTLESFLTGEVIQNDFDFGQNLLGGDGSMITDPETFLERKERKRLRMLFENYNDNCMEIKTGGAYPSHMPAIR